MGRSHLLDLALATAAIGVGHLTGMPMLGGLAGTVAKVAVTVIGEIGTAWIADLGRASWHHVCDRWLTPSGILNHDLATALGRALQSTLDPKSLTKDYKATNHYRYLRSKYPKQAAECDSALEMLRQDLTSFFGSSTGTLESSGEMPELDVRFLLYGSPKEAQAALDQRLADYLFGHDPDLIQFVQGRLRLDTLAFHFGEELKRDTEAWRAFERLLLEGLQAGLNDMQLDVVEIRKTTDWLKDQQRVESAALKVLEDLVVGLNEVVRLESENTRTEILSAIAELRVDVAKLPVLTTQVADGLSLEIAERVIDYLDRHERRLRPSKVPLARVVNTSARPDVGHRFRDRIPEANWLRTQLAAPETRLIAIIGRGGFGKTALVSHVLAEAEVGSPILDAHPLQVRGVAYFHPRRTGMSLGRLYTDFSLLLGEPAAAILSNHWKDSSVSLEQKACFLVEQTNRACQDQGALLVVLDSLEEALDDTGQVSDEGLRLWLEACLGSGSAVRIIVTSRQEWQLPDGATAYVRQWNLDHGLPEEDAVAVLQVLDPDSRCGLSGADGSLLRRAVHQTGGVPFSLEKIAGLLRKSPRHSLQHLLDDRAVFAQEVTLALAERGYSHLSPDEKRAIEVVAIYEQPVPSVAVAFVLLGQEHLATVEAILDELARGYFVTYHPGEGTWALHGVDAEVVCARLSLEKRAALHRRVAEYYELGGAVRDVLAAADHRQQAGDWTHAAGLLAEHAEAMINLGQASELLLVLERFNRQGLDAVQWAEISICGGLVYTFLRKGDLARQSFQEALVTLDILADSPETRARKARACRGMGDLLDREDPQEALTWLHRGLQELGDAGPEEEAALLVVAGGVQLALGEYDKALTSTQRGLELLPGGHEQTRIRALIVLGTAYSCLGDLEGGQAYTRQALELAQKTDNHFKVLTALSNLGVDKYVSGDWVGAAQDFEQAADLAAQLGNVEERARLQSNLGTLQTNLGEHEAAQRTLTDAIEAARSHGLRHDLTYFLHSLAELYIQMGEWDAAHAAAQEADQLATELGAQPILPQIYASLAQIQLAMGSPEAAVGYAERSVTLARELEASIEEGIGLRALGQALLASGQHAEALVAFQDSLALLGDDAPYEAARTKAAWGCALLRDDEIEERESLLREARAIFSQVGARHDLNLLDQILGR